MNLFEVNSKSPTLSTLLQISDTLDITTIEFLNGECF